MSFISIKNLSKIYGENSSKVVALNNINLEVEKGEFIAIMGTSGSGKSTLLNVIGCMDRQTSGEYLLDGKNISKMNNFAQSKLRNEKIGFIFQNFALLNDFTVFDNVELPLSFRKMRKKEKRLLIEENLAKFGLSEKIKEKVKNLSGGQKQRVAITRAICSNCDMILADEPTGALDSKNSKQVMQILSDINKEGKTIIIITHDEKIASYCSRVLQIEDGEIYEALN